MLTKKFKLLIAVSLTAALGLISCSGGDTDGGKAGDQDFHGTEFIPTEDNSGSIELEVKQEDLSVAETSGFFVHVKDSAGADVPDVTIACDSEKGVAIVEPTTGKEITDSGGRISGIIGCAAPGSYLFGCRAPVGANIRKFVTIRCSGPVPTGFDGFSGSAGGGLGTGGSDVDDDAGPGGTNTDGVRLSVITVNDTGAVDTTGSQIDVIQGTCGSGTSITAETFGDTFIDMTVINNTNSDVRFTSFKYTIPGVGTSGSISFIGESTASADGGQAQLSALVFSAVGTSSTSDKYIIKSGGSSNIAIPSTTAVKNVKFTLFGTTSAGESIQVTASTALSFGNYNHCGS